MKKILLTAAALLSVCAVLFTSCAKKGGVKGEDEISGSESAPISEMSEKCTEYSDKLKELKLDNIKISDNVSVEIPQKMLTGDLIVPDNFDDKYEQIFSHYVNDYDEKLITINENSYPTGPDYDDTDKNLRMSIGCNGFFFYQKDFNYDYINTLENVRSFNYQEALNCGESYKMKDTGKELSVADATKKAQDFADEFVEVSGYPNELKVMRATVCTVEGEYIYHFDYDEIVYGSGVLEYYSQYKDLENDPINPGSYAWLSGNDVGLFAVQHYFDKYDFDEEVQNAPDPVYAAQYVSNALAEHIDLNVKRIALKNALYWEDNIQEVDDGELSDREISPWAIATSYDIVKARPCYVFYFDDTLEKERFAVLWLDDMTVNYVDNNTPHTGAFAEQIK